MKLEMGFTVVARCAKFEDIADNDNKSEKTKDFELRFDTITAPDFLFKTGSNEFSNGKYLLKLKHDFNNKLIGILMCEEGNNNVYYCKNFDQLFNDVANGYIRLKTLEKIATIMEFDFDAGLDFSSLDNN